jgi:hypothetical protein
MPTPKVNSWLGWRIFTVNRATTGHVRKPPPPWTTTATSSAACAPSPPLPSPERALVAAWEQRHRAASPAATPTHPSSEIEPQGLAGHPPPTPDQTQPPVRRNLAGPSLADAQGPNCEFPILSRDSSAQQGYTCNPLQSSRDLVEN